jgi:hypothetical protein
VRNEYAMSIPSKAEESQWMSRVIKYDMYAVVLLDASLGS